LPPRNAVRSIYESYHPHFPWLTIAMIKGRMKQICNKDKINTPSNNPNDTPTTPQQSTPINTKTHSSTPIPSNNDRKKGGRPQGTTNVNTLHISKSVESAKAEITFLYKQEYDSIDTVGRKRVSCGLYDKIHETVKAKRNLPKDFTFPYNSAKKRIARNTDVDIDGVPTGHQSPLRDCEEGMIDIIIKLGKIGAPITCGTALRLINELIDGTIHQQRLVLWKKARVYSKARMI
jgi:hypothetical protein